MLHKIIMNNKAYGSFFVILAAIVFMSALSNLEGKIFPVVGDMKVVTIEKSFVPDDGFKTDFTVKFEKKRDCTFLHVFFRHKVSGRDIRFTFNNNIQTRGRTRPAGDNVTIRPWTIYGVEHLSEVQGFAFHSCHPLWTTITEFEIVE